MIRSIVRRANSPLMIGCLLALTACGAREDSEAVEDFELDQESSSRQGQIWAPGEGDHFWVFPESKDKLGSGGEFHVYVDPETLPAARASFARFALGVDGALPEHRHDKTEEIAYFISGTGTARLYEGGVPIDVPVGPGYVWYNPPGVWHAVTNTGDEPLVLVFATIPNEAKGLLSFFRRISVKPGHDALTLPPDEFARIAAEHDLILRPAAAQESD
jgi:mannose-6-phosphate isomerase-like protein (cupin superfamily)